MLHEIRWTAKKVQARIKLLEQFIYCEKVPLPAFRYRYLTSPAHSSYTQHDIDDSTWDVLQPNDYWAYPRTDFVLRTEFTTPNHFLDDKPIALVLPIGIAGDFSHPEALVFIDGVPYASCDRHHQEIVLPSEYCDGQKHTLALKGWTGIGGATVGDMTSRLKMHPCFLSQIHQPTRDFVSLARVALEISNHLEDRDPVKHHLLSALDNAFRSIDIRTPIGIDFYASIPDALKDFKLDITKAGPDLGVEIAAIGHAHIDVAWLWTLDQTRQKASRTFHNVIRLMEQYPDFVFAQSQPQLYEFIRQDYPELFKTIQTRINEGRWEALGGMWVEADCNLSGSESLARQFLLGRNYFSKHFGDGTDSPVLWLPDVFGYAWNLPQLIIEAGLKYFFTIKIGWSQYNRLPYDSFWWQGLDGTKVLTHFSTTKDPGSPFAATYNSDASPAQILGTWLNFQQKDYGPIGKIPPLLMSYGYGDGGGGPTAEMLENIQILRDFPAAPKVKSTKVADFFEDLEVVSQNLPVWNGELYLEYHRGTYTTQARNKRANRKSETLLHDAEFLAAFASILDTEFEYPYEKLTKAWQLVCLNQFHDIIPGSSIAPVYQESLDQYELIQKSALEIQDEALRTLTAFAGGGPIIVNSTSFTRNEVIDFNRNLLESGELPPYSITPVSELNKTPVIRSSGSPIVSSKHIENDFLLVEINQNGDFVRLYEKALGREILPPNSIANQFQAFEDIPLSWDAWDIDIFYDDKKWLAEPATSIEVVEANPYRATIEIHRRILNSDFIQQISLSHRSPRLDIDTVIQWRERRILLKVAFPVEILSPTATYEIQWGNVERPTHRNTSWDWARFETAAQKWVDLSEGNFGVSLLNDCKYGHDIQGNIIRLTLLRGTTAPDPEADLGEHEFKYSLLPHAGTWGIETAREAYALNYPLNLFSPNQPPQTPGFPYSQHLGSFIKVNKPNIIIETIKRAEDGNGVIIRCYEFQRQRCNFRLETAFPMSEAWRTNILERNQEEIPVTGASIEYRITPYQILTLRLIPA